MTSRLAQAVVTRGGWYGGRWLRPIDRHVAEDRWAKRSYANRTDEMLQCGGCRFFAATGLDFGICANEKSPLDGSITFEHGGCARHSEAAS